MRRRSTVSCSLNCSGEVDVEITAAYPAGMIGSTKRKLRRCGRGRRDGMGHAYPKFAATADKEGFSDIAKLFKMVATVETHHHQRYSKLLENVENGSVFRRRLPQTGIAPELRVHP